MSNTYSDSTGVIQFRGQVNATPVIKALFSAFELDPSYPGGNQAYIARLAELSSTSWDAIFDNIVAQLDALGLQLPESDDDGPDIEGVLMLIASKLGCEVQVEELLEEIDFDDDADLEDVFQLAMLLNDGHGLQSISLETGWHCDKPRLFEFGGAGVHYSANLRAHDVSSSPISVGQRVDAAMVDGKLDDAAMAIANHAMEAVGWALRPELSEAAKLVLAQKAAAPLTPVVSLRERTYQMFVGMGSTGENTDAPRWLLVDLDQSLVDTLGRLSQVVRQHDLAHVEAWASVEWAGKARMTCDALVVGTRGFWWSAYPKHGDHPVETVHADFGMLQAAVEEAVALGRQSVRLGIDSEDVWLDCLDVLDAMGKRS